MTSTEKPTFKRNDEVKDADGVTYAVAGVLPGGSVKAYAVNPVTGRISSHASYFRPSALRLAR